MASAAGALAGCTVSVVIGFGGFTEASKIHRLLLLSASTTYSRFNRLSTNIWTGEFPALSVVATVSLVVSITDTVPEPWFSTYNSRPSGLSAPHTGKLP